MHNLPAGDWDAGERGIACDPSRVNEFRAGVAKAVTYAHALGVPQLNCLVGKAPAGVDAATLRRTLVDNLRFAAAALKMAKLRLLIEPINAFDIPGFYLNRTDQALDILDEVDADNAFVQYDIYHAQRTEGELAATLQSTWPASATCSWPTTRAATSQDRARSTTPSVRAPGPHWLQRMGGLRIQAGQGHGIRAALDRDRGGPERAAATA